ncbi:MAG TPA: hypothetical protein VFO91_08935, partial [Anaerolineales bacterium]|nr:hypothetical protein [Anaerolineales bacterium]
MTIFRVPLSICHIRSTATTGVVALYLPPPAQAQAQPAQAQAHAQERPPPLRPPREPPVELGFGGGFVTLV